MSLTADRPAAVPSQLRADVAAPLQVVRPGTIDYERAWELQREFVTLRGNGVVGDVVILLEHQPVYTLGRRTDRAHVLFDADQRAARGIDLVEVDRGGDVTYHGPGQLVGYPILELASVRGVVDHVRALEAVVIDAVGRLGVQAARVPGLTGVWVGEQKLAAIGVRVAAGGITSHGFALNVAPDLEHFAGIVPCGIRDRGVCSLASLGVDVGIDAVADAVELAFAQVFDATLERASLEQLLHSRRR